MGFVCWPDQETGAADISVGVYNGSMFLW
jgi:hypothetical protein